MYQHRPRNSTRELLEFVELMTPGAAVMVALESIDRASLSDEDAVLFLQLHQRVAAWWSGVGLSATVAAVAGEPVVDEYLIPVGESDEQRVIRIRDARREELAAALRLSPTASQQQIDTARLLAGPLAATKAALDAGAITERHVMVIVNQARVLPGSWMRDDAETAAFTAACDRFQARVLPVAARGTLVSTRAAAVRAVRAIDPDGHERRRRQALGERDVWLAHEPHGTSLLMARLATEQAVAVMTQISADAHDRAFDIDCPAGLTLGQLRADVLTDLVLGTHPTGRPRISAHLNVTIPLDTLLGLRAHAHDPAALDAPARR